MTLERWTDDQLDDIRQNLDRAAEIAARDSERIERNSQAIERNRRAIAQLRKESKEQNIRVAAYQQASQQVVNLAFGLLAAATITTIVTTVFRR